MRDRKDIIHDFKICSSVDDCEGCSYKNIGGCGDGVLEREVLKLLERDEMHNYEDGLKEAWGIARVVANMEAKEFDECFGADICLVDVINLYKPEEIEQKIKEYENDFHVGDVVKFKDSDDCGVITKINHYVNILLCDGSFGLFNKDVLMKTEKHIEVYDILNKLDQLK